MIPNNEILSAKEVAELTGFSISWVRKAVKHRTIPFYKPNSKVLFFRKSEIVNYILSNRFESKEEQETKVATKVLLSKIYGGEK